MQTINAENNGKIYRIEIDTKEKSSEAKVIEKKLFELGYNVSVDVSKVYTINYDFVITSYSIHYTKLYECIRYYSSLKVQLRFQMTLICTVLF